MSCAGVDLTTLRTVEKDGALRTADADDVDAADIGACGFFAILLRLRVMSLFLMLRLLRNLRIFFPAASAIFVKDLEDTVEYRPLYT